MRPTGKNMATTPHETTRISHHTAGVIRSIDMNVLSRATEIHNERWTGSPVRLQEFTARASNGVVLGAFDEFGLQGSLSCLTLKSSEIKTLATWNEASANGTLSNHDPAGDTLLCVAISVKPSKPTVKEPPQLLSPEKESMLRDLAKQHINKYVDRERDHVLDFHRIPKGGMKKGATVVRIIENGCPDDIEAMGYNVLMEYPEIQRRTKIVFTDSTLPSILLIEYGFMYAQVHGINKVMPLTRPVGFRKYLLKLMNG